MSFIFAQEDLIDFNDSSYQSLGNGADLITHASWGPIFLPIQPAANECNTGFSGGIKASDIITFYSIADTVDPRNDVFSLVQGVDSFILRKKRI